MDIYYYLENYKVYYLAFYEVYEYDSSGQMLQILFHNHYNGEVLWKYDISYPSGNTIKRNWWTTSTGYPDEIYLTHEFQRNADSFAVDITDFPGKPYSSAYYYDGAFDASNNLVEKRNYYEGEVNGIGKFVFDTHPNPLKNIHHFLNTEDPMYISQNNLVKVRYESSNQSSFFQVDYSYEYNSNGLPVKCYLLTNNNGAYDNQKLMKYSY
jgi:hypothetical protein